MHARRKGDVFGLRVNCLGVASAGWSVEPTDGNVDEKGVDEKVWEWASVCGVSK